MDKICPCCNNAAFPRLIKKNVQYHQCSSCQTLFSDPLDNADMVGGGNEVNRNQLENHLRIGRINEMVLGMAKEDVHILDFGCGHGYLIADLKAAGYNCDGYDAYNEDFSKLPPNNKYHIITAVEVIEHCSRPFAELDVIKRSLVDFGVVMFETSFVDIPKEDGIALEDFFYIEPSVGHATIFSHHGLDVLMSLRGFKPIQHFNRNVRLYQKQKK